MKQSTVKWSALVFVLGAIMMLGACKKKQAPPPPPPPPPPPSPDCIAVSESKYRSTRDVYDADMADDERNRRQHRWDRCGAAQRFAAGDAHRLDHLSPGRQGRGRQPGGDCESDGECCAAATASQLLDGRRAVRANVKDVYFDYDTDSIRPDQQASVQGDAQFLGQHSGINFTVEGHCDERGSTEYNLALGDRRANAVKSALTAAGVVPAVSRRSATARRSRSARNRTKAAGSRTAGGISCTRNNATKGRDDVAS